MSRRDLKYESSNFSCDDLLELLNDGSMEFVEFVLRHHLPNELPEDDVLAGALVGLFVFDRPNQVLPLGG